MTFDEYIQLLYKENEDNPRNRDFHENLRNLAYIAVDNDFAYKFNRGTISGLKADSRLPIIAEGDTFSRSVALMEWVTKHTQYCGYSNLEPSEIGKILDFGLDCGFDGAINCANKAILLSGILLVNDIFAMPVWLENRIYDYRKQTCGCGTCHVVVHVYIPEYGKWVLLDPSFNAFFTDKAGIALDLFEVSGLRDTPQDIVVCNYDLNGTDRFADRYLEEFLLKSLYIISVYEGWKEPPELGWGSRHSVMPCRYNKECADILIAAKTSEDELVKRIADGLARSQQKTINADDLLKKPADILMHAAGS